MYLTIHDKYSSTGFKERKNGFNITNLLPQKLSGTVVVKELLALADELVFLILNLQIFFLSVFFNPFYLFGLLPPKATVRSFEELAVQKLP